MPPSEDSIVVRYRRSRHFSIRNRVGDIKLPFNTSPVGIESTPFPELDIKDFTEMFLKDMDYTISPNGGRFIPYEKNFILLTIIEDPHFGPDKIAQILVEDKNKDVGLMQVCGLAKTETYLEKFAYGSILQVIMPCLTVMPTFPSEVSGTSIYIDDSRRITQVGKKKDMCRYCKKENATRKCAVCKREYCDRECQVADWESQKHGMICKTPISY